MSNQLCAKALQFLSQTNWADAAVTPLAQDASTRRYFRLIKHGVSAILMQVPTDSEMQICRPDTNWQQRAKIGYIGEARLAGNDCGAFVCIANQLIIRGFSAPKILASKIDAGLILLEDLGDQLFYNVLQSQPDKQDEIYEAAILMLGALARSTFSQSFTYQEQSWPVLSYDMQALLAEIDLFSQWYLPFLDVDLDIQAKQQLSQAWVEVLSAPLQIPPVLVLRDFHAQNLIWLPEREAVAKVGLLDFQDGLFGHPAYDLVSLLQDARRDVPEKLEQIMITKFLDAAKINDHAGFFTAYRILGAQRAAKILGIFVRLAKRDGKHHYLKLLPRVEGHFLKNLAASELRPVAKILSPVLARMKAQLANA